MIARVWHGWTTPENADVYERRLREEIFPGIAAKGVAGYHGVDLLRAAVGDEVEFTTIMWFDSMDDVKAFAGEDYEEAYVPPAGHAVLAHYDARSRHYEVRAQVRYRG